jgi:GNAT superfamily N-acetyltransferase
VTPSPPEPLNAAHVLDDFDCGKPMLNGWLKTRARANQASGYTVIMVSVVGDRVVGFYGLTPTGVTPAAAPRSVRGGQPPNPLPCLLLGQLAVDTRFGGRGLGAALAAHALRRCVAGAALVGGRAVVVRAVDDDARAWWERWGFRPSSDDPYLLFRSLADVARSLESAR